MHLHPLEPRLLLASLTPDPTFANNASLPLQLTTSGQELNQHIQILPNHNLLVSATSGQYFTLSRYTPDGTLDPTFGQNGRVLINTLPLPVPVVALGPNNDILVLANAHLLRFTAAGLPDPTFGNNGVRAIPQPPHTNFRTVYNSMIAIDSQNRILLTGTDSLEYPLKPHLLIQRLTPTGDSDSAFGTQGLIKLGQALDPIIALQNDDKILAADMTTAGVLHLTRNNVDGSPDSTFGAGGRDDIRVPGAPHAYHAADIATDAVDHIVVALDGGFNPARVFRFLQNGDFDPSFNASGKRKLSGFTTLSNIAIRASGQIIGTAISSSSSTFTHLVSIDEDGNIASREVGSATDLALDDNGDAIITSDTFTQRTRTYDIYMARFDATLQPVSAFGNQGTITDDIVALRRLDGVTSAIRTDGGLAVVGTPANTHAFLLEFLPDGSPDPSFGSNGVVSLPTSGSYPGELLLQPNGDLLVADSDQILRYTPSGTLDTTFGHQGTRSSRLLTGNLTLQPNGKILTTGSSAYYTQRLNPDGSRDTTFGPDHTGLFTWRRTGGRPVLHLSSSGNITIATLVLGGPPPGTASLRILHLTPAGLPNTHFGPAGVTSAPLLGNAVQYHRLFLGPHNTLLASRSMSNGRLSLLRYTLAAKPDPTFPQLTTKAAPLSSALLLPNNSMLLAQSRPNVPLLLLSPTGQISRLPLPTTLRSAIPQNLLLQSPTKILLQTANSLTRLTLSP